MTTKTPGARRATSAALAVFAMVASLFAVLGFAAAPAQAADYAPLPDPSLPGYMKVTEKDAYLAYHVARHKQILHVDTEHADANGFWFAFKSTGGRQFLWHYQPYGLFCVNDWNDVEWNGWMNRYWCFPNPEKTDAIDPGYSANWEACRVSTGYPWKNASDGGAGYACGDVFLDVNYNALTQKSGSTYDCAPWEPSTPTPTGGFACMSITYPWSSHTGPYPQGHFIPAPDTCTGMPANSNDAGVRHIPRMYAPATGGDGSCTGAAPAPNCPTDSTHQACTGEVPPVEEPTPTFNGTASHTATMSGDGGAAVTKTKRATVQRWKKKVTVVRWKKGRKYSAAVWAVVKVTRSATVTKTDLATAQATRTATGTCTAATQEAADECALTNAQTKAEADALAAARSIATSDAKYRAGVQASEEAALKAKTAARKAPVTKAMKKAALKKAKRAALVKVRAKMR